MQNCKVLKKISTQNVQSRAENFMHSEGREEKFLNSRLRGFNGVTLLEQAYKDRLFARAAGELWKRASKRI